MDSQISPCNDAVALPPVTIESGRTASTSMPAVSLSPAAGAIPGPIELEVYGARLKLLGFAMDAGLPASFQPNERSPWLGARARRAHACSRRQTTPLQKFLTMHSEKANSHSPRDIAKITRSSSQALRSPKMTGRKIPTLWRGHLNKVD